MNKLCPEIETVASGEKWLELAVGLPLGIGEGSRRTADSSAALGMTNRRGWWKGRGLLPRSEGCCQGIGHSCVEGTRCLPVHKLPQASRLLPRLAGAGGMTER